MFQSSLARFTRAALLFASFAACTVASANESNATSDGSTNRFQPLAAGDEHHPPGPPQEAIAACASKNEGSTCSVQFRDRTVDGICRNGPDGNGPLACAPQRHRRPPEEAFAACASKSEGSACSVEFHGETLEGTCRKGPQDETELACMPNRPPARSSR